MVRLLLFLKKLQPLLLFLVLEIVLVNIFISQNSYQRAKIVAISHWLGGKVQGVITDAGNFFELSEQNAKLVRENAELHSIIAQMSVDSAMLGMSVNLPDDYKVVKVVNSSFTKRNNYITVAGGRVQGIVPDMALFNSDGIVGYTKYSSDNFSVAVSVLNHRDFKTSGKILGENSSGSIYWDAESYREVVMEEISSHTPIEVGDTIITTEYSNIFPEGIPIGVVESVSVGRNELLIARLGLLADFGGLDYLYAVSLEGQQERELLEETIE